MLLPILYELPIWQCCIFFIFGLCPNLISNITGFHGEIKWDKSKPDGTPKKQLDVSRINNLGWYARIPLKKGLEETINLFKKNYWYLKINNVLI